MPGFDECYAAFAEDIVTALDEKLYTAHHLRHEYAHRLHSYIVRR